jgi:hypothetical protein
MKNVTKTKFVKWIKNELTPQTKINYFSHNNCVFARFLKFLGHKNVSVGGQDYSINGGDRIAIPFEIVNIIDVALAGLPFKITDMLRVRDSHLITQQGLLKAIDTVNQRRQRMKELICNA